MTTRRPFGSVVLSIGIFSCVKKPPVDENQSPLNSQLMQRPPSGGHWLGLKFPSAAADGRYKIKSRYFFFEPAAAPKIRSSCFSIAPGFVVRTSADKRDSIL